MKKILAVLLVLTLVFALCACSSGGSKKPDSSPKSSATADDDEDETKEPLVLQDDTEYYVCSIKTKHVVIEKASDLSNYKIGYIYSNSSTHDSEAIAKFYEGPKGIAGYNGENDSFSGLAQDIDVTIVSKAAAEDYINKHSSTLEIVFKGPYTE